MINVDQLLKLDRLRDKMLVETGNKKIVEICNNPNQILKEQENYSYRQVEVLDGALVDLDNGGIVDEIVRMTFEDETCPQSLVKFDRYKGVTKETHGFYLRYKKMDDDIKHPFDTLFRAAEKSYLKRFNGKSEKCNEEDHRSEARLLCFEILAGANDTFNNGFKKKFNLDITNIDDFKFMLLDINICKIVKSYICKTISNIAVKVAFNGRNSDYSLSRKITNGKYEQVTTQHMLVSLDKPLYDGSHDGYNASVSGVYDDNNESLDHYKSVEEEEIIFEDENLYSYILNNFNNIFTDKQQSYLNAYFKDNENDYLESISQYDNVHYLRHMYKRNIKKAIDEFLNKSSYCINKNGEYDFKESLLVSLENILKQQSNEDIFTTLCTYLTLDDNRELNDALIDIIYSLEHKYYSPIVSYINSSVVDYNYIENDFIVVIEAIQSHYNYVGKNNNVIYNINRSNKQIVIDKYISKLLKDKKECHIAKSNGEHGLLTLKKLRDFISEVEGEQVTNSNICEVLNKYGYGINTNNATKRKNNVDGVVTAVYILYVSGHEPKKRIFKDKEPKEDISVNITNKQHDNIAKYIDNNLILDILVNTTKDCGYLRICDVRDLVSKELDIKRVTKEELINILLKCGYKLNNKNTNRTINGLVFPSNKISKID